MARQHDSSAWPLDFTLLSFTNAANGENAYPDLGFSEAVDHWSENEGAIVISSTGNPLFQPSCSWTHEHRRSPSYADLGCLGLSIRIGMRIFQFASSARRRFDQYWIFRERRGGLADLFERVTATTGVVRAPHAPKETSPGIGRIKRINVIASPRCSTIEFHLILP